MENSQIGKVINLERIWQVKMNKDIKFGEIREYISGIDKVSICMLETLNYSNYEFMEQVPLSYDEFYLYGIGMIMSEFGRDKDNNTILEHCIEIMLSEKPRSEIIE